MIYYARQLDQIMVASSPDKFYEVPIENTLFSADKQFEMFKKSEKSSKIPLIKLIMGLYEMIEFNVEIFRDICIDCIGRVNPKIWKSANINISEGGCLLQLRKRFKTNDKLLVCLQPINTKAISVAEANIVNVIEQPQDFSAKIALQFYFFRNETQINIEKATQIQEIELSMDVIRRRS